MKSINRKSLLISLIFVLFLGSFMYASFGDWTDNFSQYPVGTTTSPLTFGANGNTWTFSQTGCSTGFDIVAGGRIYSDNTLSLGNMTGCTPSGSSATMTASFTSTSTTQNITVYYELSTGSVQNITACVVSNCGTGTSWTKLSLLASHSSGSNFNVALSCQTTQTHAKGYCYFTEFSITGANLNGVTANFQLEDWTNKPTAYNLVGYTGTTSSVAINYTGNNAAKTFPNIQTSALSLPFSAANTSLITFFFADHVCGYGPCFRTLIPTSGSMIMYMDNISAEVPYLITFQDVTAFFKPGAIVRIMIGTYVISSGYLDSSYSYPVDLVPGSYTFQVAQGSTTFSEIINLGANLSPTVQNSANPQGGIQSGSIADLTYSAYWACNLTSGEIVANYKDSSTLTNPLNVILYNNTAGGSTIVYNDTITGPIGSSQYTFSPVVPSEGSYTVAFQPTYSGTKAFYGPIQLTPSNPSCPSTHPSIIPSLPTFPVAIFGLSTVIGGTNGWNELFALVMIILTVAVFGARSAALGFVIVSFETMFWFLALFIPLTYIFLYVMMFTSMIGFLVYRRRRFV